MDTNNQEFIKEQEAVVRRIQERHDELFAILGMNEEELLTSFQNSDRFTDEEWKEVESKRKELEELIDSKIQKAGAPKESSQPSSPPKIEGHWIHVR